MKRKKRRTVDINHFDELSDKEKRDKLPKGQRLAKKWPVLSIEKTPKFNGRDWDLKVEGLVENSLTISYEMLKNLPKVDLTTDIHCVTTWSLLDQKFGGVSFKTIVDMVKPLPNAKFVTFEADSGYSTAIPLLDGYLLEHDVILAYEYDGQPLAPDHGGPLRLLVPQLYLWKSVKWLKKIIFLDVWERGFWEVRGYHQRGDPWKEERYSSQELL